ncbi:hypothetical protein COV49_01265 [Candidatus Falkowbacteria bacterium CG11_big_fil_rev_8_21_14_0_20_39_10]|uniref:Band 7 domain-containing protein n=1 Tax=Candidatus Falkowbacteria bacterium CG11_big_fil_rev_8_21_14_0_20_39_10 TaxID=1974570 RepID=A0A2M6K9N9_9BACT|nr:MAG: hypothetical protein COV49_01265 [Candidatus Falkowbacteria bacterium CG11_big_fil_rev_8_21_14_0_20_39_10]
MKKVRIILIILTIILLAGGLYWKLKNNSSKKDMANATVNLKINLGIEDDGKDDTAFLLEAINNIETKKWQEAEKNLKALLETYPNGRYSDKARLLLTQMKQEKKEKGSYMWAIILLLLLINLICTPFCIKELASRDWFFTIVNEGSAKAIMGGGGFQRFVWQYKNQLLNVPGASWHNDKIADWEVIQAKDKKPSWLITFWGLTGIRWLGLPGLQNIYSYTFKWNSLAQDSRADGVIDAGGGIYFKPHTEVINYILLQPDVYYVKLEEAEDAKMVPLNIDFTMRIRIVNPYKALFRAQEWLEITVSEIIPLMRRLTPQDEWENLTKNKGSLVGSFLQMSSQAIQDLTDDYGVEIETNGVKILRIAPGGKLAEEYEKAATEEFKADQEAKKIGVLATAEEGRIQKVYGKIQSFGPLGEMVRHVEALETVSKGSSNTIVSAPELVGLGRAIQNLAETKPERRS